MPNTRLPCRLLWNCIGAVEVLHVTPQVLIEFRSVATRPKRVNGLGLTTADADTLATEFEALYPLLSESPDIYPAWKALVQALGVIGKQVHDARLVAICHCYRMTHLLTFNVAHLSRLAAFGPGVEIIDPRNI